MKRIAYFILIFVLIVSFAYAHSGRTDAQGGHYNRKTGVYHYHNRPTNSRPLYTVPQKNESYQSDGDKVEDVVYITRTGAKYHRGSCHYLRYSKSAVSKKKAIDSGYLPCKVCNP